MSDDIEDEKDRLHDRLLAKSRPGIGGCHVWLGACQSKSGLGVITAHKHQYMVHRVAAWVWLGGFRLNDRRVQVKHSPGCVAHCLNPDHLQVVRFSNKKKRAKTK